MAIFDEIWYNSRVIKKGGGARKREGSSNMSFLGITGQGQMETLQGTEEMLRGLLQSTGAGIYLVQERKFQYVSPLFEKLSGYTKEELIGRYPLKYVHPEDREAVREKAVKALKGQRRSPYEYKFIRKDGKILWVLERVVSIQYQEKPAAVGNFIDITTL